MPRVRGGLTPKQAIWAREWVENNFNGTQAAVVAYPNATNGTARVIATENITKPNVRNEVVRCLTKAGMSVEYLTGKVKNIVEKTEKDDTRLNAIRLGLKLHDAMPNEKHEIEVSKNIPEIDGATLEQLSIELQRIQIPAKKD